MTENTRPKQTAFRLPEKTLNQLDKMIEEGSARNRTDAVILAVDKFFSSDGTKYDELVKKVEQQGNEIESLHELLSEQQESSSGLLKLLITKPDALQKIRDDIMSQLDEMEREEKGPK